MKKIYLFILIFIITQKVIGQQNYCDFEGNKVLSFGISTGIMDSLALNPAPDSINSSLHCAKYVRDTAIYDVIKLYPSIKLEDVTAYADSSQLAPKIQMKLYTSAPIGTEVQLQLGIKSVNDYPAGVHSEYVAATTVQNAWEVITFNYFQSPDSAVSFALSSTIDKIVILFHPNSSARDIIYFDDLTGPSLNTTGVSKIDNFPSFKLSQNNPNPAKQNTVIGFQLNSPGLVSLELYDMLGKSVLSLLNQEMKAGNYSLPIETSTIHSGIYFYVLKKDGFSQTKRMVVSKNY